ncbi:Diadenylate cyclase spyDAC; Bacterial checkpoint controller DisA with nucleotide-binding domain [Olavius sp. associated proteobacterium Delta 1]|nr:Diadenylate cyclase spyDAC; Bacterial checkpoint controller DisA with nucleotide-binding domain [Olavius sp. associated proteobacterium Delta 1]
MEKIIFLISSLRWQDIVDIGLVSYILFRFYILFRGTNAFRVLIGMTILWFFQQVAVSMGLIVTSWVVQGIVALGAFIIIVIFRNEIRSVLQATHLKAILWDVSSKAVISTIEIIVQSVYEMGLRKCGALIVFPGKDDVEEVIQSGIPWKGEISKEMILSVFWPDNPVHDGAAVIQGDQIIQVGAILPLSRRDDLPTYFGTRHRAALGLAEATDALIIAVSEERGDVVVVRGGTLKVVKQKRKLEQILRQHKGVASKKGRELIKEKLMIVAAALFSVIFITGVWFSVSRGGDTLLTFESPVVYLNRDPSMEIVQTSVNTVSLELEGSGALIKSIKPDQVQVKLDLNKSKVGPNSFTITRESISLPPGIVLKGVAPTVVEVDLDVLIKKEMPVQIDWVGRLPDHFILTETDVQPETVAVIGGKRILENIATIYTEKVPLNNLEVKGTISVNLALTPASLKIAPGSKEKVTITYLTKLRNQ